MISVGQLAANEYIIAFIGDNWKISRRAMIVTCGKKIGTLCMTTNGFRTLIVVNSKVSIQLWHQRLEHMRLKGMKVMQSSGKLSDMKSEDLELYL